MTKFIVKYIVDKFGYEVLAGADGLNRLGLELAGFDFEKNNINRRVILLSNFVNILSEEIKRERYEYILNENIPMIMGVLHINGYYLI